MHRNKRMAILFFLLIWAAMGFFPAIEELKKGQYGTTFLLIVACVMPGTLMLIREILFFRKNSELQKAFLQAADMSEISSYVYLHENYGVAVNCERKTVSLMDRGNYKTYSFNNVLGYRTWAVQLRDPANALFVRVKDGWTPEWRISMEFQSELNRWAQIFDIEVEHFDEEPAVKASMAAA